MITGLTSATPNNLLLDAGAFFKNFTVGTDTPETASAKLLGATDGGGTFSVVPTVRQISVDGGKQNVKELQTVDFWTATMTANLKEHTLENLKLAIGAAKETSMTAQKYTKVEAKEDFEATDYITNIVWVGKIKGKSKPVIIELKNALSINGLNLTFADKNEATIPVTLTANYDLSDMDASPFAIYYPAE